MRAGSAAPVHVRPKPAAAREQRNDAIVALLATERTTAEVIAALAAAGHPLSRFTVVQTLHHLELEGRIEGRRVSNKVGSEKAWRVPSTAASNGEHVPHLPRTKASQDAAENAAACGYDTLEERAMDRRR